METVINLIATSLLKRGHELKLILTEKSDDPYWERFLPVEHMFSVETKFQDEEDKFSTQLLECVNIIKKEPFPDAIVTLSPFSTKIASEAVKILDIYCSVVTWLHFNLTNIRKWEMVSYADGHLCISSGLLKDLEKFTPQIPSKLIYNPVVLGDQLIPRSSSGRIELLYVGRLYNYQKRVDLIINALSQIQGDWHLTIIGEGKNYPDLIELAEQKEINDKISWLGWKDDPWSCIREVDVLLLASNYEGFGLVLAEALSRGITVVSSDCPSGPTDIVRNGENGWLFPSGDEEALVDILDGIINKSLKLPESEICSQSVERFSTEQVSNKFEEELLNIVQLKLEKL
ncbi:hypothetical protein BK141_29325 [Paenibacillus sp. FSL R5-0765]|nr:hypothetical protein BK141_29325 [Paenibacillus sp. FSL R5-0765]